MEISKTFTFESSHILPRHPGKCSRLHGHSWKLTVYVKGEVNPETGFVMDYGELKGIVQPFVDELDHRHLGAWTHELSTLFYAKHGVKMMPPGFYPSSENLIIWIAGQIDPYFRNVNPYLNWSRLELDETCTSKCILTREEYEQAKKSNV